MIELVNVSKIFNKEQVLKNCSLEIASNELTCITGKSGAGKTTLLNIMSCIEKPSQGQLFIEGKEVKSRKEIQHFRRKCGYVFQNYGLVDDETVRQNIDLALKFTPLPSKEKQLKIVEALEKVGLSEKYLKKKVFQLSGGEQQRVALSRIIVSKPDYIFADEPTGNLDEENKRQIFALLQEFSKNGASVLFVSHDPALIERADRVISCDASFI